tara:strand:- start:901 stop:1248 length:348 start_codon:yes stop_codon:yes gene_type:complete
MENLNNNNAYFNNADISKALEKFFDRGGRIPDDEPVYVSEPEPTPEPEPIELTVHDQCKAIADAYFKEHYEELTGYSNHKPSRKKSQPKPSVVVRARSLHKLNPEEAVSSAWGRI